MAWIRQELFTLPKRKINCRWFAPCGPPGGGFALVLVVRDCSERGAEKIIKITHTWRMAWEPEEKTVESNGIINTQANTLSLKHPTWLPLEQLLAYFFDIAKLSVPSSLRPPNLVIRGLVVCLIKSATRISSVVKRKNVREFDEWLCNKILKTWTNFVNEIFRELSCSTNQPDGSA